MAVRPRFKHIDVAIVRVTTDPGDLDVPSHLDLSDRTAVLHEGSAWLSKIWVRPEVRHALGLASPVLAAQLDRILAGSAPASVKDLRRAIGSVASYLLRWQRRATPFGMFAGVATATVGSAQAVVGQRHRAVARADAEWLTALIERLERHPQLRPRLHVIADNTGFVRDGRFITARRIDLDAGRSVPLREASVRHTRPVQATLELASTPIRFGALVAELARRFPAATPEQLHAVLDDSVDQGFLITSLRQPMTIIDGLGGLIDALTAAGASELDDVAGLLGQLKAVGDLLAQHNITDDPARAAALRSGVAEQLTALVPGCRHTLAVDTAVDAQVRVPEAVLAEALLAASVLLRVSTKPFGTASWLDYHSRFRARYGEGALVPVRDLLADSGLGYPTGYLGAPRARPAWRTLTERDAVFLALVQRAALDGSDEIVLSDADIAALTVGEPDEVVPPARVELAVAIHAHSPAALDAGKFLLRITGTPPVPTSMAGRFIYLLDEQDQARFADSYTQPSGDETIAVQLSFPPRRPHNENVTRVPRLLSDVVALAEHPTGAPLSLDDLAVTADSAQMYLVQISTGRRVVPQIPHALDTTVQSPPLARFLTEVADARTAVFGPFDPGAARTLPYLPRVRYRRTILAAARWILSERDVRTSADAESWGAALEGWRRRWRVPGRVVLCHGELRLPLNLDHRLDQAILHGRLAQARRLELQEDAQPAEQGWIGRPAELLIPMVAATPSRRPLPPLVPSQPLWLHREPTPPGRSMDADQRGVVHARLVGNPARFDEIITAHLPRLNASLGDAVRCWWMRRNRDLIRPDTDQYLTLVLRLADPSRYGEVIAQLAAFAADLADRGLPGHMSFVPYQDHPGRYGHGPALAAAEYVFAVDTACAIAQSRLAERSGVPAQALAAASMVRLATAFAPDDTAGYEALLGCLPRQSGAGELDRILRDHALRLAVPGRGPADGTATADGDAVAAAWHVRDTALREYFHTLAAQRDPRTVLPLLLHEHHVRALGVDPTFEKTTNRLVRAAALRCVALAGKR